MGGKQIRTRLLLDDEGFWKDPMWLDELILPSEALAGSGPGKQPKPVLTSPLPINTCSLDSLMLLPGVGTVMAGRIDAARRQGVLFTNSDDLRKIKGIGEKLSARLDTLVIYGLKANSNDTNPDYHKNNNSP